MMFEILNPAWLDMMQLLFSLICVENSIYGKISEEALTNMSKCYQWVIS